jgi:predicted extracellular nuclease
MSTRRSSASLAVAWLFLAGGAEAQSVRICQIQGTGPVPALLASRVTVTGVVTADFTASLGGFFLQEPSCDGDPATSDAIWVQGTGRVTPGNRTTVTGRVADELGLTRLVLESLSDGGPYAGGVEAVRLSPSPDPATAAIYLEAHEGMLVSLPASRVVAATNRFGDAWLMPEESGVTRLYRGDSDGRKLGLTSPSAWLSLNHGDRVSDVSGPLTSASGEFKVLLRASGRAPTVERGPIALPAPMPAAPLSVATYNLGNLFDPVDDPVKDDGPSTPSTAQYAVDLARRAISIGRYLGAPDVVGVQEAETIGVLQDLAAQPELAPFGYRAALIEGGDSRGIDVGLLYRSDRVSLLQAEVRPACTPVPPEGTATPCALSSGGQGFLLFARPPLVARFETIGAAAERLTVVVNHFQAPQSADGTDQSVRLAMAQHVLAVVDELRAQDPGVPVIVLGDFGDFEDSPTLLKLVEGGRLVNAAGVAVRERAYTFLFQGLSQARDHVLVDASLAARVLECAAVHVNVDFGDPGPGAPLEASLRASDHDPVRMTLRPR